MKRLFCYVIIIRKGVDNIRTYTQEEKQAVIQRFISGEPSANILADTGIPKSTFYSWLRIYCEEQELSKRRVKSEDVKSKIDRLLLKPVDFV